MSIQDEPIRPQPPTEPAEPAPPPKPSPLQRLLSAPVTLVMVAISIVVFIWAESVGSTTSAQTLIRFGAVNGQLVYGGQYWRLLTAMFLHIGPVHLLWNCWAGWGWCSLAERRIGSARFLPIYLAGGLGASATSALMQNVLGAGASGAMFAVVGLTFVLRYRDVGSLQALIADRWTRSQAVSVLIWLALGFSVLSMDNYAHLGGLVFGVLLGLAHTQPAGKRARGVGFALAYGAVAAAIVATAVVPPRAVQESESAALDRRTSGALAHFP